MFDILVIGGGPAGMTAALYAARAGKSVVVVEREGFGGQIATSPRVENIPGNQSISGAQFADQLLDQIMAQGAEIEVGTVFEICEDATQQSFTVKTEEGDSFEAKTLIIATGVSHRRLDVPGSQEADGHGVSYCVTCDGGFVQGQEAALVGGGNSAIIEALALADLCSQLTVIHRGSDFPRAEAAYVKALRAKENVSFKMERSIESMTLEGGNLASLQLVNAQGAKAEEMPCRHLFVSIGLAPANGAFASVVKLDEAGYVVAGEDCVTSNPRIFAAGDCRSKRVRQVTTACADGTVAALAACRLLDAQA